MTYPDNEVVTFGYNDNMQVVSVNGTSVYAQSIAYDSAGRMTDLVRGTGILDTIFHYNDWDTQGGRLQNITTARISDSYTLQNLSYNYDVVGNILTITDTPYQGDPQTQTFDYDALDRLWHAGATGTSEQGGYATETNTYNPTTGNLDSKGGPTYTYDTTHKHAVASVGSNSYGYDDNGNMTDRIIASGSDAGTYDLSYDPENRLVQVKKDNTVIAQFAYDADGKQVKSVVDGATTYYVNQGYEVKDSVVTKYRCNGKSRVGSETENKRRTAGLGNQRVRL